MSVTTMLASRYCTLDDILPLPQDLRERYACVELKASLPLVPFRETVVVPGQV